MQLFTAFTNSFKSSVKKMWISLLLFLPVSNWYLHWLSALLRSSWPVLMLRVLERNTAVPSVICKDVLHILITCCISLMTSFTSTLSNYSTLRRYECGTESSSFLYSIYAMLSRFLCLSVTWPTRTASMITWFSRHLFCSSIITLLLSQWFLILFAITNDSTLYRFERHVTDLHFAGPAVFWPFGWCILLPNRGLCGDPPYRTMLAAGSAISKKIIKSVYNWLRTRAYRFFTRSYHTPVYCVNPYSVHVWPVSTAGTGHNKQNYS